MRFWAFECSFLINNNFQMAEVFVGARRKELLAAMERFFRAPRSKVVVAGDLGAWFVDDGKVTRFHDAKPFVTVEIAKQTLSFQEAAEALAGDLDGAISRVFLAKGKATAIDANERDEEDDDDPELKPFKLRFDGEGFLATLPDLDAEPLAPDARVVLVRPVGIDGYGEGDDPEYHHPSVELAPGWSDAELDASPRGFDPKQRFKRDLAVPMV